MRAEGHSLFPWVHLQTYIFSGFRLFHGSACDLLLNLTELVVRLETVLKPGQFFIVKAQRCQTFTEEKPQVLKTHFCPQRWLGRSHISFMYRVPWQTGPLFRRTGQTRWSEGGEDNKVIESFTLVTENCTNILPPR